MRLFITLVLFTVLSLSTQAQDIDLIVSTTTKKLHDQTVYPVVRVSIGNGGGSGTVIYSEARGDKGKIETFILTNHHVISGAIQVVSEWSSMLGTYIKVEKRKTVRVEVFRYENLSIVVGRESFNADVKAHSRDHDLALLQLRTKRGIDSVVKLLRVEDSTKVHLFDPIIITGCSLLHAPLISTGQITSLNDEIDNKQYWMSNAQIIYGNSGGAAFTQRGKNWYFVGVPSRISVTSWGNAPITHMGYFIPISRIYEWCKDEHLDFIFDKDKSPGQCFAKREELSRKALQKSDEGK